jgi:hypothetical protein
LQFVMVKSSESSIEGDHSSIFGLAQKLKKDKTKTKYGNCLFILSLDNIPVYYIAKISTKNVMLFYI